jgi:hypothetical protein
MLTEKLYSDLSLAPLLQIFVYFGHIKRYSVYHYLVLWYLITEKVLLVSFEFPVYSIKLHVYVNLFI